MICFFLYLLNGVFGPYLARFCSFLAAVFVTWIINRNLTFKDRYSNLSFIREFLAFFSLMLIGGTVNFCSYVLLVFYSEYVQSNLYIGVVIGSLAGMLINFLTSRFFLFKNIKGT